MDSDPWNKYVDALEAYQRAPSADSRATLLEAHERWVKDFVPERAGVLQAEFRARLAWERQ